MKNMKCPLNFTLESCSSPKGFFYGYTKDGVVQCRVSEYEHLTELLPLASYLPKPEPIACKECPCNKL